MASDSNTHTQTHTHCYLREAKMGTTWRDILLLPCGLEWLMGRGESDKRTMRKHGGRSDREKEELEMESDKGQTGCGHTFGERNCQQWILHTAMSVLICVFARGKSFSARQTEKICLAAGLRDSSVHHGDWNCEAGLHLVPFGWWVVNRNKSCFKVERKKIYILHYPVLRKHRTKTIYKARTKTGSAISDSIQRSHIGTGVT